MPARRRLIFSTPAGKRVKFSRKASAKAKTIIRKAARRYIKRRRGRKKIGGYGRTRFVSYDTLLQHKFRTRLTYCDTKTLVPAAGQARYVWRLNSLFDPDFTGGGHQPGYHDEWALLYKKYRVTGCKWYITCSPSRQATWNQATTTQISDSNAYDMRHNPGILAFQVNNISGTAKEIEAVDKNILRETRAYGGRDGTVGYKMTGVNPYRTYKFKGYTSIRTMLDSPTEANTTTAFNNAPAHGVYLHVAALSKDGGTMADYRIDVRFVYHCEISEREPTKVPEQS